MDNNLQHCVLLKPYRAHFVPFAFGKSFIAPIITARDDFVVLKSALNEVNNKCFAMQHQSERCLSEASLRAWA